MIAMKKWPLALLALTCAGLLLGTAASSGAVQLLLNPGFEEGVANFNGDSCGGEATLAGWTYSSVDPVGPQLCMGWWDTPGWVGGALVHGGVKSARAFHYGGWDASPGNPPGQRYTTLTQVTDCVPGAAYTASAWLNVFRDLGVAEAPEYFLKLKLIELDEADAVLATHEQSVPTVNAWANPSISITTLANTKKLKYQIEFRWLCNLFATHLNVDDCVLEGPAANPLLIQGSVTSGASPVAGALVTAGNASATTSATGAYSLELPGTSIDVTVRASKDGFFAQKKLRTLYDPVSTVNFDLVAVGDNLLKNAGFDDNAAHGELIIPDGWVSTGGTFGRESFWLEAMYTNFIHSGEEALGLMSDNLPEVCSVAHPVVTILPGTAYTAKVWAHAAGEGVMWYAGSAQKAALRVEQFNLAGDVVDDHFEYLSSFDNWQQLTYSFTSKPDAVQARVSCWANMAEAYSTTFARAVFDDVELNGPAGPALPGFYGTVKSGAAAVPYAKVEIMTTTASTLTDADGIWSIASAGAGILRASKPGYYAQRFYRVAPVAEAVKFNLVAKGSNLIVNAGFDDGWNEGGWVQEATGTGPTYARGEWFFCAPMTNWFYYSGEDAIGLFASDGGSGGMWYNQIVSVQGGASYSAAVKFRPGCGDGFTTTWGNTTDDQVAGLKIQELDSSGAMIKEHALVLAQETGAWENLTTSFTTLSATRAVKIGPYVWQNTNARANGWDRGVFDDVELNGPVGAYGLSGTVTSGGTPIEGAIVAVTLDGTDPVLYTTNAAGFYSAVVDYGAIGSVVVSKPGFYTQSVNGIVNGVEVVNFDLDPFTGNQVINPGFDDPLAFLVAGGGWSATGLVNGETNTALFGTPLYISPTNAAYVRNPAPGLVYQDVPVVAGQSYSAACQFIAGHDPRYGSQWGVDPNQKAALSVQLLNAVKQPLADPVLIYADVTLENRDQWKTLSTNVNTTAQTAFVRIGGWANMVDNYDGNLARAVFDDFELNGPGLPGSGIGAVKESASGTAVKVTGKVVTSSYKGYFYIEEEDRSSGIRVSGVAYPGYIVNVNGQVGEVNGEKAIVNTTVSIPTEGSIPDLLITRNRSLDLGLSAVGLYMKLHGRVDFTEPGAGWFTMTDGSGASLKVYGAATLNDFVTASGAVGAEMAGDKVVPVLRALDVQKAD